MGRRDKCKEPIMEKVELAYAKKYWRNSLFVAIINLLWGINILASGNQPAILGLILLFLGIILLTFQSFERGRRYYITIDQGILKAGYFYRQKEYILKDLTEVEQTKYSLKLYWKEKETIISTHQLENRDRDKLYASLRFHISNP